MLGLEGGGDSALILSEGARGGRVLRYVSLYTCSSLAPSPLFCPVFAFSRRRTSAILCYFDSPASLMILG